MYKVYYTYDILHYVKNSFCKLTQDTLWLNHVAELQNRVSLILAQIILLRMTSMAIGV